MPRSSRSKSHKQSKHSSREYSDFDEDVKMKERNDDNDGKKNGGSVKVSKDSLVSGEKRKLGKDLSDSHGNGNVSEEYGTPSKRRKEKIHGGSDRWNGDGGEEKGEVVNVDDKKLKSKDLIKVASESKSKTSRKHDVDSASVVASEKDESKSGSGTRGEKRSDKESGRKEGRQFKENKEPNDKDRGSERERKIHDGKREIKVLPKQVENQPSKRGREHNASPIEEELRNIELEKELEKRMRRREGYSDKDRYQDDDERKLSTKSGHAQDIKHKDAVYGDKYREGSDRETKPKEAKCRDNGERASKNRDVKYRKESEKDNKNKDGKYCEDGEKDRRENKYRADGNRDNRHEDGKNHDDGDRDSRRRDEKYREDGGRVERNRDDKRRQDDDRDYRHKEDRYREDVDRDHRHKNGRPRDDTDREKRARDPKNRDVHSSRDHPGELETKNMKDDSDAADVSHRKINNRGGSPTYDDRVARDKDDKDRRKDVDKDDLADYRSHSIKDQHSESEKRFMSDAKVDPTPERGRLSSRNDVEVTANHSKHRSSPSSKFYPTGDHHRVSKVEETKYKEYVHEERARHNVNSNRDFTSAPGQSDKISSRSVEKNTQKDNNCIDDLSVERHRRSDARSSPLVRRNLDVDELGQRSGGSKDAKEYSDKDGKVSRKLAMEGHPDNDLSQVDGDNLSVSSPYTRSGHFSGIHKSLLPPQPPFRTGSDSPLGFGSSEDDRGKSNNRHRRSGDPNMGRAQSNWKNVPNWSSPLANGSYIPFQHIPPIFNPAMQQFMPPIFGRPPMQVNHAGMPYHVPDGDRFSGHGHPLAWRNQVEESIPSSVHSWEANNALFGDGSHGYGRLDWDQGRTQLNNQMWESSADMWKGQDSGVSVDMQSAAQKNDDSIHRPTDAIWSGQTGQHIGNEQSQPDIQAATINNTPEVTKVTESPHISVFAMDDDALISQAYLSKIDISEALTQPELYDQCTSMLDLDKASVSDEFDCKILFLEAKEGIEADISNGASLFAAVDNSVFKKAMSFYAKQKVHFVATNQEGVSDGTESVSASDQEKGDPVDDEKLVEKAVEGPVLEVSKENEPLIQKFDMDPVNEFIVSNKREKSGEQISTSDKMDMEVDHPVVEQESPAPSVGGCEVEGKDSGSNDNDSKELDKSTGSGSLLLLSNVSITNKAVMPELIEFGSVNISRIHDHSPESTH